VLGDDALFEGDGLRLAGLFLGRAGGFFDLHMVGTDEGTITTHHGDLAHLGHGRQAAGELGNHFFLVATQGVHIDHRFAKVHAQSAQVAHFISITAATCNSALLGMQHQQHRAF
jgi:hypothetical protein